MYSAVHLNAQQAALESENCACNYYLYIYKLPINFLAVSLDNIKLSRRTKSEVGYQPIWYPSRPTFIGEQEKQGNFGVTFYKAII